MWSSEKFHRWFFFFLFLGTTAAEEKQQQVFRLKFHWMGGRWIVVDG
jgi:hypothetical protein